MIICANDEHLLNVLYSMNLTSDGIIICVNEVHLLNALQLIDLTDDGRITCSNDGHSEKILDPIEVTGERRDILVNDEHLYNKYPGKNTIVPVISMDLIPSNIFLPNKVIDDGNDTRKDEQLPKALSPIEVIEEGMIISVNDEHP